MKSKGTARDEVDIMVRQFELGARTAVEMIQNGQLSFDSWVEEVRKLSNFNDGPKHNQRLIWIWDSLRKDPIFKDTFKDLAPAGMRWNRSSASCLALKRDSWLSIVLQRNMLPSRSQRPEEAPAAILLLEDLYMRPGRNDRMECCACRCMLQNPT